MKIEISGGGGGGVRGSQTVPGHVRLAELTDWVTWMCLNGGRRPRSLLALSSPSLARFWPSGAGVVCSRRSVVCSLVVGTLGYFSAPRLPSPVPPGSVAAASTLQYPLVVLPGPPAFCRCELERSDLRAHPPNGFKIAPQVPILGIDAIGTPAPGPDVSDWITGSLITDHGSLITGSKARYQNRPCEGIPSSASPQPQRRAAMSRTEGRQANQSPPRDRAGILRRGGMKVEWSWSGGEVEMEWNGCDGWEWMGGEGMEGDGWEQNGERGRRRS